MHDTPGPQRVGVWAAIRRHPVAFLLPVVVLLALGTVVVLGRSPVHRAEARLLVGRFDVEAQAVPGYVAASETLAGTLSRVAETGVVLRGAADAIGQGTDVLAANVSVSPIPESAVIRVEATGSTEALAVARAEAVTEALLAYEDELGAAAGAPEVLEEYRAASTRLSEAVTDVDRINAQLATAEGAEGPALREQLIAAEGAVAAAQLEVDALAGRYQDALRGASSGGLRVISPAGGAGDDGLRTVQLVLVLALIAGLGVGAATAALLANRPVPAPAAPPARSAYPSVSGAELRRSPSRT